MRNENLPVSLQAATPDDSEFLLKVYESSRELELSLVNWNAEQRDAFVRHQANAQLSFYQNEFPEARHDIILFGEKPVGRIYVLRLETEIRILDITVLTAFRRKGIGTSLIKDLQKEAAQTKKPVQIYVETFNPSQKLFQDLGFTVISNDGMNLLFEWRAND